LYEHGAKKVIVGESSGWADSTKKNLEKTGLLKSAKKAGAEVIDFDKDEWVNVNINGEYLNNIKMAKKALDAKKIIYIPCMKTHSEAKFTLSLKLVIGCVKQLDRVKLHSGFLQEKIVELNTIIHPDLIIMDGRKCFINEGPSSGELRNPNLILASGDRIAIDIEALKIIKSFKGNNLNKEIMDYTQIKRAIELNLGVKSQNQYIVKTNF
jgi:uncharacterized protein (DUF362 family)